MKGLTLREFRIYHFHIVACFGMIENTWEGVTKRALSSDWKKHWPESVFECGFEGFQTTCGACSQQILSSAKIMGVETDTDELEEDFSKELATEEFTELQWVSQQEVVKESLPEEEEVTAKQKSSGAIREMLNARETVASHIEKNHPNKTVAMCATNLLMIMCRVTVKF
ncbi:hypothetical protein AVEN_241911-1 [Araneus ventricosus]|uniref:DDE-1 domain-containing protein n=1 Tax=Araneus ventricosus TaxID=182803 RepID=A0A4Y2LHU8_ARAVE|nr:hypothetical protein AVEN_241911-1 [Araneus ventricosus]